MSRARDRADGVLHNRTHEDTDGGRESLITFKGEQSGGEISTLAQIQASHDGTSDDEKADLIFKTNDGSDGASPTERARIQSDGILLVGKTASDGAVAGHEIRPASFAVHTKDNGASLYARRIGSGTNDDGDIAVFQNANGDVGSIGSYGDDLIIGTGDTRIRFIDSLDCIMPLSDSAGTSRDAAIDLGHSETRFRNIYTSGGIYLGAASNSTPVAANYLDDYEEGTWTPAITGVTVTSGAFTGEYRKVGGMVTVTAYMENATLSGSGDTITGLPFTNSKRTSSSMPSLYNHQHGDKNFNILLETNTTTAYMQYNGSGAWVSAPISAGSGRYMNFQITYCTAQ